jgi:glutamate synthase (NADPH/NADH) small chain
MGKPTGFLEYQRKTGLYEPVEKRLTHFREFTKLPPDDELSVQGARCMDCGIPFCHSSGCPVYNLIPEWNDAVYRGQWREALERLERTNNLPEITGRICPAPCEPACTLSINSAPVTIKQLELAIIERGFREGWVIPRPPRRETGRRVAVIGSGPAGIAAAQQLRRAGHRVTLFEKSEKIGGILRYGIPDFKLEKWVLDRRLEQLAAEGVEFETGVDIGSDISVRYLRRKYDAILLTVGAGQPRDLKAPGRELDGIHFAMDYLIPSNRFLAGEIGEDDCISARGKEVLVIGGGDTGSDCVGTANRQGASRVYQYEIMPRPREWTESYNPQWPDWPAILRASSSHEEGCVRDWSIVTKSFSGREGRVTEAHCARVEWQRGDDGRMKMVETPGSEFVRRADLVLLAMGFVHLCHDRLVDELEVDLDARGNLKLDTNHMSSQDGVFGAGDAGVGASLVVRAIFYGREAARSIDQYLR